MCYGIFSMNINFARIFIAFSPLLISIIFVTGALGNDVPKNHDELAAKEWKALDSLDIIYPSSPTKLPIIRFLDDQGNEVTLEKFKNKFVALHFWAIWCAPCRKELPTMNSLQKGFSKENLVVVPLSVGRDDVDDVRKFYMENKIIDLPVYTDPTMESARAMLVSGIPFTILIDSKGREVGRVVGERDWSSTDVHSLLREIIQ